MALITDLPDELLHHIAGLVQHENPKLLVPLLEMSKRLNNVFKKYVYQDIWVIVSRDNYFKTDCSVEEVRSTLNLGKHPPYKNRTLVTDLNNLIRLVNLLLERKDLLGLVDHFHVSGLDFDPADKSMSSRINTLMDEKQICAQFPNLDVVQRQKPENFFIPKRNVPFIKKGIFEAAITEFFFSDQRTTNIRKFTETQRRIANSRNGLQEFGGSNNPYLFNTDKEMIDQLLFCPFDFQNNPIELSFLKTIEKALKVADIGQFKTLSLSILSFAHMMVQSTFDYSSFGYEAEQNSIAYLAFNYYYITEHRHMGNDVKLKA